MKYIFIITIALFFISCSKADETNAKNKVQKIEKEQVMTDEEFLKKFMELEERKEKVIAKTKALEKLENTVDELSQTLNISK